MRSKKSPAQSQVIAAAKASGVVPGAGDTQSSASDQSTRGMQPVPPLSDVGENASQEEDRRCSVHTTGSSLSSSCETIDLIRSWHRQRCFAMEQRKRIDLSLGSFLRMMFGWSMNLPEAQRKTIAAQVQDLMSADAPEGDFAAAILASAAARKPFDDIEAQALKQMKALAETLPVWAAFGEGVRGFGAGSLAVIVGEAGDLANYASVAKLWKRMGLAVIDGNRQGAPGNGAPAETWIEHGYSPVRRSRMWNVGDALIKGNRDGDYRRAYLARKEYELARDPECKPIRAHRRAQRYMEKRLLKHLWQAWRRTDKQVQTRRGVSAVRFEDRRAA